MAHTCTYLMGLIYALELRYPNKLKYTFEIFQNIFLDREDTNKKCPPRSMTSRSVCILKRLWVSLLLSSFTVSFSLHILRFSQCTLSGYITVFFYSMILQNIEIDWIWWCWCMLYFVMYCEFYLFSVLQMAHIIQFQLK